MPSPSGDDAAVLTRQQLFGARIRQLREARGWSQDTLAHLTGMHRAYPHRIEAGQVDPRLSTIARLAEVFEMKITDLLDLEP